MEQDKEFHLSFSRVAIYDSCPLRYKFIYIDKLPTAIRSYFSFGNSIHKVLEMFYHPEKNFLKLNKPPSQYLEELLEEHWISAGYRNEHEEKKAKTEAEKILKTIYRENIFGYRPAYLVEKSFSFDLEGFKIIGRIDRIDKNSDGFKIIDYKTNRILPKFFREIDLLQPAIYYLAAKESLGIDKIEDITLFFVRFNKQVSFELNDNFLNKSREKILRTGEMILQEKFEPRKNSKCSTCEFRSICPLFKEK